MAFFFFLGLLISAAGEVALRNLNKLESFPGEVIATFDLNYGLDKGTMENPSERVEGLDAFQDWLKPYLPVKEPKGFSELYEDDGGAVYIVEDSVGIRYLLHSYAFSSRLNREDCLVTLALDGKTGELELINVLAARESARICTRLGLWLSGGTAIYALAKLISSLVV